jgi:uncharacterized protein YegL
MGEKFGAPSFHDRRDEEINMDKLKEFTVSNARPLPVIVLADVSGSMSVEGKIQALNLAVREMLDTFRDEDDLRAEIHVSVITFGGNGASEHLPLGPAAKASWSDMPAVGYTPMGQALTLVLQMLENKERIPSRSYRPTIVLVSDGQPNDEWTGPLEALLKSERGGKAFRMAMAIGADADIDVLQKFLANSESRVFKADEARKIRTFFRMVTMSVTSRSRSANPNTAPAPVEAEDWDL